MSPATYTYPLIDRILRSIVYIKINPRLSLKSLSSPLFSSHHYNDGHDSDLYSDSDEQADNLERFTMNFRDIPQVRFPRPVRPLVSSHVLVETFEEGVPVSYFLSEKAKNDAITQHNTQQIYNTIHTHPPATNTTSVADNTSNAPHSDNNPPLTHLPSGVCFSPASTSTASFGDSQSDSQSAKADTLNRTTSSTTFSQASCNTTAETLAVLASLNQSTQHELTNSLTPFSSSPSSSTSTSLTAMSTVNIMSDRSFGALQSPTSLGGDFANPLTDLNASSGADLNAKDDQLTQHKKRIARIGADCFIKMVFLDNFIHR